MNLFLQIGIMIMIATAGAYLTKLFRQPLIPAYILTGLVLGPVLGLIKNTDVILTLAEIGIAFLLFIVGLELDITKLKDIGLISTVGGTVKVALLFSSGFLIAIAFGFVRIEAMYIGIIIAFSSTMVVVKLLSDKHELNTLHGRIIIGTLLMEDIIAVFVLSILTTLNTFTTFTLLLSLIKGISVFLIAIIASKFIFPGLFKFAAKSQELLFLASLSVCFAFSLLFFYLGFSIIIGAFVAGVALANLPYRIEIIGRVRSLRDFFATLFFVSLGMELVLGELSNLVTLLIVLTLFAILLKPLLSMIITSLFGYTKRTSFLTAISLAQTSEFSLIIIMQGFVMGHISYNILSLTVLLAMITITTTSYFIKFDNAIYRKLSKSLNFFDLLNKEKKVDHMPEKQEFDVILCGYNRIGYSIYSSLKKMKKTIAVVDFNPDVIKKLARNKIPCLYGDVGDTELLDRIDFRRAQLIISTVPDEQDNLLLIKKVKEVNKKAIVFVTANKIEEALELYQADADYVILPHFLGGEHVALLLEQFEEFTLDIKKILENKFKHIEELKRRHRMGHEHPMHH